MEKLYFTTSWLTQAAFVIAILSGLPLLFFYHTEKAYDSVQIITYLIPNGNFIRKFHYFSSEALIIFALIHTVEQFFKRKIQISKSSWNYAVAAFVCILLLLFTGFVLKADQSGYSAGIIAINMLHKLGPLSFFSRLIESSPHYFYWRYFIWHIVFLPCLLVAFIYFHTKKIDAPLNFIVIASGITIVIILLLRLPADIAPSIIKTHINGPWFFRGVEEMLKIGLSVPIIAVQIIIPFLLIILYRYYKYRIAIFALIVLWTVYYATISMV